MEDENRAVLQGRQSPATVAWDSTRHYADFLAYIKDVADRVPIRPEIRLHQSEWVAEWGDEPCADYEDRLHAMTMHHVDLSLMPLMDLVPVVFHMDGVVICHPNNYTALVAALSQEPTAHTHHTP